MRGFQEKKRWQKIMQSKPILGLLGLAVLFFAWSVFGFWGKMEETRKERAITEKKVAELEEKKEKLASDIEKLGTEEGVEENIREKFGLAREGEGVIIIVDDQEPQLEGAEKGGFWNWLKNLFK